MATKVKGEAIKEGSIPLSALADDVKGNFYGKYGLNGYLGELIDTNPLFIEGSRTLIYMLANNKIYHFGQGVYTVSLSGNGPNITITGNQTSKGWTFTASGNTVALYEVKFYASKIDIEAPTPDWNAQEGEAGYIENKPFGISYIGDTHFGDNEWQTYEDVYLYVAKGSYNDAYLSDSGYIRLDSDMSHTFDIDGGDGSITVHNYNGFLSIISQDYFDTEEQAAEFLNNVLKVVTFKELNSVFIADTVVKTTPQNLEVEEMHQALANLGIDPVVWKYICNPIKIVEGRNAPDDIIEIFNSLPDACFSRIYTDYLTGDTVMCFPEGVQNDGRLFNSVQSNGSFVVTIENGVFKYNEY